MIGQEELCNKLKSYTLANLPHSNLFIGPSGCGKHTLVKELSDFYNVEVIDITNTLDYETIVYRQLSAIDYFYIIDMNQLTEKEQNVVLKFIEEPSSSSYIFLLSNSKTGLLETILNRCNIYDFLPYKKEVLSSFLQEGISEDVIKYCSTPGQVIHSYTNIKDLEKLCDNIVNKLNKAGYDNALNIADKLNYKDDYNKFDLEVFFNVLIERLLNNYITTKNKNSFLLYKVVVEYKKRLIDSRINKRILIENMVINMKKEIE